VLDLAARNAALETGQDNPLDDAILAACRPDLSNTRKLAELPFDFIRKRVSVAVADQSGLRLITKGAFHHVIPLCTHTADGRCLDSDTRTHIDEHFARWSDSGLRVLAIATRPLPQRTDYTREVECEMSLEGFLTFLDQPKAGITEALTSLTRLGVSTKVITGDNALVARHVATLIGLRAERVLTGQDLDDLHDEALWHAAERTDVFAEVDPNQKERIILALKKMGHVVGFLGDGVNDAPAMHAADASLSVEHAVDVARDAADFVLLERGLDVIRRGVEEGRRTFANTLKYVLITTSANLGNMVSMAAASVLLPFLPLLASQILLNNFLSDVPAIGLAGDRVDPELVDRPRRWDIGFIARFMVVFGLVSSVFDVLTFGVLRWGFAADQTVFRTAWFVESLLTELAVALVVRTRRPFFQSRPGTLLLTSTAAVGLVTFAMPFLPLASFFGFVPLPAAVLGTITLITVLYVAATELAKRVFYERITADATPA
jgi:Mg2+-importing ATPase